MPRRIADLTPEEAERRRNYNRDYMRGVRGLGGGRTRQGIRSPAPTPAAIADRDDCYAAPLTLGQRFLGDPLPGRSALDRMRPKA